MTGNTAALKQSLDIFIDELIADEELRDCFLRNPMRTLRGASEWGLPLSESEMRALIASDGSLWERVAAELNQRLQ